MRHEESNISLNNPRRGLLYVFLLMLMLVSAFAPLIRLLHASEPEIHLHKVTAHCEWF
jgi:hypothetical protein